MKDIKKYSLLSGLMLFLHCLSLAQFHTPIKENQKVPDSSLGRVLSDTTQKLSFKDLKGKLVILDFWNIHCTVCLKGFPKMNALQKQYGDRIKIVLVTKDKEGEVKALLTQLKPDIGALSVITDDTVLTQLFPHYGEPHHVWIDQEGIFRFATFDHNATEQNIDMILNNRHFEVTSKQDGIYKDDEGLLLQAADKFSSQIQSYSILVKGLYSYTVGRSVAFHTDPITGYTDSFKGIGLSPLSLLKCAYNKEVYGYEPGLFGKTSKMRLVLEVKDSASLFIPIDPNKIDSWQAENFWSYEVKIKPESEGALNKKMQWELSEAFPFAASIELRKRKYLAIVRKDLKTDFKTKGIGTTTYSKAYVDLRNVPFSYVIMRLNEDNHISKLPIIDETGIKYNIDLRFKPESFFNILDLRAELNSVGLDIMDKENEIPMLIIRDKKNMAL